jgi:hypothetical protein
MNACCVNVGKWGTEWGKKYRSQIMFVAFWFSFVSLILLGAALGCISTDSDTIKNVPFFQGTFKVELSTGNTSKFNYYAGLNRIVFEGCDLGTYCPPTPTSWDSAICDQYLTNCNKCADSSSSSVSMVIASFITQIIQCSSDLGRSIGRATSTVHAYSF